MPVGRRCAQGEQWAGEIWPLRYNECMPSGISWSCVCPHPIKDKGLWHVLLALVSHYCLQLRIWNTERTNIWTSFIIPQVSVYCQYELQLVIYLQDILPLMIDDIFLETELLGSFFSVTLKFSVSFHILLSFFFQRSANLRWVGSVMPTPATSPAVPPPDGGWGWAVVLGSFISIGFSYAFPKAITVFFKEIQNIFGASYSQIAWISSIMLAVMYAAGK